MNRNQAFDHVVFSACDPISDLGRKKGNNPSHYVLINDVTHVRADKFIHGVKPLFFPKDKWMQFHTEIQIYAHILCIVRCERINLMHKNSIIYHFPLYYYFHYICIYIFIYSFNVSSFCSSILIVMELELSRMIIVVIMMMMMIINKNNNNNNNNNINNY